jgi:KipI family sensor histidine kinase inhibitor
MSGPAAGHAPGTQEPPSRGLRWAGTRAFLLECPSLADVVALHARLTAEPLPGQTEALAAAETLMLAFRTRAEAVAAAQLAPSLTASGDAGQDARTVEVDVVYDGEDLAAVAALTGLSEEAVVAAHADTLWVGAFGGFAPGFTYCTAAEASAAPFDVPRRQSPRTAVPAGSVAVAGTFSAVYPRTSPGGWQLLGRTDAVLWDLDRERPALIRPGDRVRYRPVRALASMSSGSLPDDGTRTSSPQPASGMSAPGEDPGSSAPATVSDEPSTAAGEETGRPGLAVVDPGMQSLLQDLGRAGLGDLGVAFSGAADKDAARQANRLVGNAPGEAVVETLFGGLSVTARGLQVLALTGAEARAVVTDAAGTLLRRPVPRAPFALRDGETLTVDEPAAGLRTYLALRGGIEARADLGSRSTDVMSGIGPAPLAAGDELVRRQDPGSGLVGDAEAPLRATPRAGAVTDLRITLGPREDWFDRENVDLLTGQEWEVTAESNRIGVRLAAPAGGRALTRNRTGELASEGVVSGALQVPPSGLPVLFLADHPVTGGYPVIAVVVREDLGAAAQLPPGARVRLVPVDPETLAPAAPAPALPPLEKDKEPTP